MKELCVISGGTSGIGLAIAKSLAQKYDLALIFKKNTEKANIAKAELLVLCPNAKVEVFQANLANTEETKNVYKKISDWHVNKISILINCAGANTITFFATDSIEIMLDVVRDNLFSCMNLTHIFLRDMYKMRKGKILNFSSIASEGTSKANMVYGMSKLAIEGFTRQLSQEVYQRGIQVNCIKPGLVSTPMTECFLNKIDALEKHTIPINEVVEAVSFILSANAEHISGTILSVDNSLRRK